MKTISDRIFELLKERGMSQKEFAEKTGIAESTISDWKRKKTNPVSDKIQTYVVDRKTELGTLIETYQKLDVAQQNRLMGYMQAMLENSTEASM